MESIRKWFYKPKKDDTSLLAQFFYADEALNLVAAELDSFDGRKDPERCSALVNHLRQCQDKVLSICNCIMDDTIPGERANRDFRVKFPDDVMQENLAGQLWFGAECLAAGSSIMNRESESAAMRPLAKALTKALENVRNLLREQCLRGCTTVAPSDLFTERVQEALKIFDRLFAEFELSYVSAMVPVKTPREYELQQLVVVLFSETLQRALEMKLLTQDMVDDYDPALMFTIPRLAIVSGLLIFPDGPLCLDRPPTDMSEMFRPFRTLLHKIRELLWTLNKKELYTLEKLLCSSEELDYNCSSGSELIEPNSVTKDIETKLPASYPTVPDLDDFVTRFYIDYPSCKQFVTDFYAVTSDKEKTLEYNNVEKEPSVSSENGEESEDETEWVGEISECETIITDILNVQDSIIAEILNFEETTIPSFENNGNLSDNDGNSVSSNLRHNSSITNCNTTFQSAAESSTHSHNSSDNASSAVGNFSGNIDCMQQSHVVSTLPFPSSTLIANDFAVSEECYIVNDKESSVGSGHDLEPYNPENLEDETGGFLIANQVGHDIMLSTSGSQPTMSIRIPCEPGESAHEAMSAVTATLSTLLLSHGNDSSVSSPVHHRAEGDDDTITQSPIDSGVGTVVSCSDTGSFSDRSPEAPQVDSCENKSLFYKCSPEHQSNANYDIEHCQIEISKDNSILNPSQDTKLNENSDSESPNFVSSSGLSDQCQIVSHSICDKNSVRDSNDLRVSVCSMSQQYVIQNPELEKQDVAYSSGKSAPNASQYELNTSAHIVSGINNFSCTSDIRTGGFVESDVPISNLGRGITSKDQVKSEQVLPSVRVSSAEREEVGGASTSSFSDLESAQFLRSSWKHPSPLGKYSPQFRNKHGVRSNERVPCSPGGVPVGVNRTLEPPVVGSYSSSCSSCRSSVTASSDSCSMSSDTSSFNSECQDDEEIALAMQAAEIANRNEARAKFRSSEDLVHRLFVCIAGVADQLQTNFAGDLRNILKCVFLMSAVNNTCSSSLENESNDQAAENESTSAVDLDSNRAVESAEEAWEGPLSPADLESPPPWVPDGEAPRCMSCEAVFTVVRRRHHCRNCGKVFCARCSSNSVPLPRYGHVKPVRVCNRCFLYQVTPFTVEDMTTTRS